MRARARIRHWLLAGALSLLFVQAGASAREWVLPGRVIDARGEPVSGLEVLLHRVTDQGGARLSQAITDEVGRFTLRLEAPADAGGVFFVATRYEGRLYVGPMLRPPFPDEPEHIVQVGVAGTDVDALMRRVPAAADGARSPGPGGGFSAALLAVAMAIGVLLAVRGHGPSRRRRELIRLAELED